MFFLSLSNFRVHKIRMALTISAVALSVGLVVAVTSGYTSMQAAAQKGLAGFLGTTNAQITRRNERGGTFDQKIMEALRKDPDVKGVQARLEINGTIQRGNGTPVGGIVQVMGVQRPDDKNVEALRMEEGDWFDRSDGNDGVVDQVALERLGAKIGDTFIVPSLNNHETFHIVGIAHKPNILATTMQSVYVPLETLQKLMFPDKPGQVTRVLIDFKPGIDEEAFFQRWNTRLTEFDQDLRLRLAGQARKEMDSNLQGLSIASYLGGAVSMGAAMFIIFSALSMGVAERQRSLAILRAVGALRGQIGRMVLIEAAILGAFGIIIGIPLGMILLRGLVWKHPILFSGGEVISWNGVTYAAAGSMLTAMVAALLPAWGAMSASPLEAMTPLARPTRRATAPLCFVAGLLLLCIDPIICFAIPSREIQLVGHFGLGVPATMLGAFLTAPLLIYLINATLSPLIATICGVQTGLLKQQMSGAVWRFAGAGAALMVGLAILIVTQTQGVSTIQAWRLPDKFPDVFIYSALGLDEADQKKLEEFPEIRRGELLPIAIASPEFGTSLFGLAGAVIVPNATLYFGVDPDRALDMMGLDFRQGSPEEARRLLKLGGHVIVTQEYLLLKGLGVGTKLSLNTNQGKVDFTVAGVVWSPGLDVFTSTQDLGTQFDQRTVACVFGTISDAKKYFGVERVHLFGANIQGALDKATILGNLRNKLNNRGLDVGDVRQIKYAIQRVASYLLDLVSLIAYAAMVIASLGVTNTIMAGIRVRRWQLGILRSIGLTRGQLLRLILAEAIVLAIVGIVLGLIAGLQLSVDAHQLWASVVGFRPPMILPWQPIWIGIGFVAVVSIVAALWPAVSVARTEPLALLQAGRATM